MRSGRLQRRGAWVALFAIALQLVLTFGHMHPLPAAASSGVAAVTAATSEPGNGSSDRQTGDIAHDICAICVATQMANAAALPPPAALALPVRVFVAMAFSGGTFAPPRLPSLAFETRAPPTA